jgi:cell pole-organizing protein PopZ
MTLQSAVLPKQSVEEILASIRQAIADDESRRGRTLKQVSPLPSPERVPAAGSYPFATANDDDWDANSDVETQNVIELAIEKAIDSVSAALSDTVQVAAQVAGHEPRALPPRQDRDDRNGEDRRTNGAHRPPLLSARSGAAVAASFEDLAHTVAGLSHAEVNEMAQEMLRPMLKAWLDDNLPSVVERLVREEIERVSRGR